MPGWLLVRPCQDPSPVDPIPGGIFFDATIRFEHFFLLSYLLLVLWMGSWDYFLLMFRCLCNLVFSLPTFVRCCDAALLTPTLSMALRVHCVLQSMDMDPMVTVWPDASCFDLVRS